MATMNVSLPDQMKDWVEAQAQTGRYANSSDYVRDLIRKDQERAAKIAAIPMILTALVVFVGGTFWTITYSFTNSKLLPRANFVGLDQYERLWGG